MLQVPIATPATVLPLSVQIAGLALPKLTARPEVAVALAVVVPPTARLAGVKLIGLMVWLPWLTAMVCVLCGAAAKVPSPARLAARVQVPTATPVTMLPLTVQIDSVALLKLTASPELAVALAVVVTPAAKVVGEKLIVPMVWLTLTGMLCVTAVAAR
jgi:hypothetical protein